MFFYDQKKQNFDKFICVIVDYEFRCEQTTDLIILIVVDINTYILFENCVDNFNLFIYLEIKRDI